MMKKKTRKSYSIPCVDVVGVHMESSLLTGSGGEGTHKPQGRESGYPIGGEGIFGEQEIETGNE